jgi:uncharacterized protein YaaR (DUF327 family)
LKVRETLGNPSGMPNLIARDDIKVKPGRGAEFHNELAKAENMNYEQHLDKLVNDIVKQGQTLAKRIDVRELILYKGLISEFLEMALGGSKKFSKQSLLDRRGRHKVYALVKTINTELDLLTQDVMNGEKDNIGLLKRLDDIRGLIMDIFM